MFEKLKDTSITLKNGDTLATRCTMVNYKGNKQQNYNFFIVAVCLQNIKFL